MASVLREGNDTDTLDGFHKYHTDTITYIVEGKT